MTRASDLAKLLGAGATILDGTTISTADNTTQLTLTSTDADASVGPNLVLQRDSASPADNDLSGTIKFIADNDAGEATDCVSIFSKIIDASNGSEDASLLVNSIVGGSQISRFNITPTEIAINDDSIDSDFRVESNGNANMLFVDGGNDRIGIGTSSPSVLLDLESTSPTIKLTDSDASGTPECEISGAGGDLILRADKDNEKASSLISFEVDGTERMRIHNTGSVSIGTTDTEPQSGGSAFKVESLSRRTLVMSQSGTGNANIAVFFSGGNISGAINIASGSATYGSGSDYRIKENIVDLTDATTRLKQLKPKRFNFITNPDDEARDGFLAHEVSSIVPEAVIGEKDAVDENGEIIVQQLDPSKLVPLLVKTIQELEARIVALETA